jgi:hypothetical protein
MEHPKIAGLPDGAFRLWVAGLAYCQKFLTDGVISDAALRGLRGYTAKRRDELVIVGLWDAADNGVSVHDYLDWNVSREHVLNSREQSRERLKKHKEKRVSNGSENAHPTVGVCVGGSLSSERGAGKTVAVFRPPAPQSPSDDLAERAGRFVEHYGELYQRHRNGARYLGKPNLDWLEAVELCRTWDDARLSQLAEAFLTTDHEFAEKGSRTMAQFRAMASWCDSQLIKAGIA